MRSAYTVSYGYGDHYQGFDDFEEALAFALAHRDMLRDVSVRITGDGYDAEYTYNGPRTTNDGLTDEERERIEEVGL